MEKNKKIYTIIFIIAVIYIIIFFVFFFNKKKNNKVNNYINLAVGNDALFVYKNKEWRNITTSNRATYNWYLYDIYDEFEQLGKYYLIYSGVWNLIDDDKNKVNLDFANKLGISSDFKYNVKSFNKKNNGIDSYISDVLSKYDIITTNLTVNNIISIDIDNDSVEEQIYTISNAFSEDDNTKAFGFIFLVDNNKINIIYEKVYEDNSLDNVCKPYVSNILELDNKNYLMINCSYYSNLGKDVILYRYKNEKFKEIISN